MTTPTLSPLAKYILALLLTHASPGKTVLSRQVMSECGSDGGHATCNIVPVCERPTMLCAAPRWNRARDGWTRAESREVAAQRFATAAAALARTAAYLTRCTDELGELDEECKPVRWPEGPLSLALAGLTVSFWESAYREDIMWGHPPLGRGSDGEFCIMQIMPSWANDARFSQWIVRAGFEGLSREDAIRMMLGSDRGSLERCYETGLRILARKRWNARYACKGKRLAWSYTMFSFYGTGSNCSTSDNPLGDWAATRDKMFRKFVAKWPDKVAMPTWAVASYGAMPGQPAPVEKPPRITPPRWRDKPSRATNEPLVVLPGEVPVLLQLR